MKKFFLGVFAIAGLVACVQSEEVNVPNPADNQIALSGYVGSSVRGAEDPSTKVQNLDHFTVWAYVGDSAGEVFNNELVSKSGSEWTYDKPRYWMEGYEYRFFAITPYGNGVGNVEVVNNPMTQAHNPFANGLGQINFTNIEGAEDVLYASYTKPAAAAIPEKVTFNFNHILSKVKFTFINGYDDEKTTLKIKEVKMVVPAKGYVTLNPANLLETPANERVKYNWALGHKDVDGNVTDADATLTLDFKDVDGANNLSYGDRKEVDKERLTIPALATQEYKITFKVEIWNGNAVNVKDIEASLTNYEFVSGTAYNLVATITPDALDAQKIEFAAEIIDWYKPTPEDHEIGYYKTADGNTYVVTSNDGLKKIADEINAGVDTNRNIVLSESIDLNATRAAAASNWTPIGSEEKPFTGTFDGKGFTISNLTLVEEEAKEGKAFIGFFGYAKNATIKNVTFENVNLNIPCLDIDHSQGHIGAVAGSLEGTSTIENVTVKGDIKVYATQNANGASRVAVIAGGNSYGNVTMENVHVIANDGSYLIANNNTGALAGQLQGKAVCKNCSSNIDVTVNKFFAGGLIGLAAGDQLFENCHTTGDIAVVAGRSGKAHDHYRVGGIAGGWADGAKNVCTLVNCSYTGKLTGVNSDGSVAEAFDYLGYVGRGYTLNGCAGSKVVIDGISFVQAGNTAAEAGVYTVTNAEGEEVVAAGSKEDLPKTDDGTKIDTNFDENTTLLGDITLSAGETNANSGYAATGVTVSNGAVLDGKGHTLTVKDANTTWACCVAVTGGTIKNLTVAGAMRGIFMPGADGDVYIDNVTFQDVVYTFNSDAGNKNYGVYLSNCTINGWTSHSDVHKEVVYTNCSFGEGSGYAFCRPYGKTDFVGCAFEAGFAVDAIGAVTFENCTLGGVALTAENIATLVVDGVENVTVK